MTVARFLFWARRRFRRNRKKAPAPITTIAAIAAIPPTAAVEIPPLLPLDAGEVDVARLVVDEPVGEMVGGRLVADWVIPDGTAEFESTADGLLATADEDVLDA